jgi:hypothetical protein
MLLCHLVFVACLCSLVKTWSDAQRVSKQVPPAADCSGACWRQPLSVLRTNCVSSKTAYLILLKPHVHRNRALVNRSYLTVWFPRRKTVLCVEIIPVYPVKIRKFGRRMRNLFNVKARCISCSNYALHISWVVLVILHWFGCTLAEKYCFSTRSDETLVWVVGIWFPVNSFMTPSGLWKWRRLTSLMWHRAVGLNLPTFCRNLLSHLLPLEWRQQIL